MGESENMAVSADQVRRLREITGAGMMDCKRALEEADGDLEKARDLLRTKGLADAAKRAGKIAREGVIDAYIHLDGKLGVLIEVNCETDFVANTDEFRAVAHDLAVHVAAHDPWWITRDDVPPEEVERERKLYEAQAREEGKHDEVIPRIVDGKMEKSFFNERVLMDQPFYKDQEGGKTVGEVIAELSVQVGEKVEVRRFARFVRGEDGPRSE